MIRWPWRRTGDGPSPSPVVTAGPLPTITTPDTGWSGWSIPWPLLVLWAVLWGWETSHWLAAALVVTVIALPAVVQVRWTFSVRFRRRAFWSIGILVSVMGTYAWLQKLPNGPVWFLVSWLPVMLLPLLAEDRWGAPAGPRAVLPALIKAWPWSPVPTPRPAMSRERWAHWAFQWPHRFSLPVVIYPRALYAGLIWATVLANASDRWTIGIALISGLVGLKSSLSLDGRPWAEWLAFAVLMLALGGAGMAGMRWTQSWVEQAGMRWLFGHHTQSDWFDPSHADTRIGQTGALDDGEGLRFRILWDQPPNTHLPVTVYDVVTDNGVQWAVSRRLSSTVPIKARNNLWTLPGATAIPEASLNNLPPLVRQQIMQSENTVPVRTPSAVGTIVVPTLPPHTFRPAAAEHQAILSGDLTRDTHARVPLPLPTNTRAVAGLDSAALAQGANGSLVATSLAGALDMRAMYVPDTYLDLKPPSADDRRTPVALDTTLDRALMEAGITAQDTPGQAAQRLKRWFQDHYHYTLSLTDPSGSGRSLTEFLTRDREGHCEYFATATALMLRRVGIPTRYVTGVLVNEAHPEEDSNMYWVRDRHFHAWVAYWDGSGWKTLDTTPPDLGAAWAAEKPWYAGLNNAWLHWQYVMANLNIDAWEAAWAWPVFAVIVVLVALLAWLQRHRFQTAGGWFRRRSRASAPELPVSERAFEERLARVLAEHPRRGEEPWGIWARRVGDPRWQAEVVEHYRRRYGTPPATSGAAVDPVAHNDR